MLSDFFQKLKSISFVGCTAQYFFSSLGLMECCLLAAMAYDRCAAICDPVLCPAIMSSEQMVAGCCTMGFFGSVIHLCALLRLHFCGPNVINHFFCDLPQLLILSCSDTFFLQVMTSVLTVIFGLLSVLVVTVSCGCITSAQGRSEAFKSCASLSTAPFCWFGFLGMVRFLLAIQKAIRPPWEHLSENSWRGLSSELVAETTDTQLGED
ncbi:Olfactory receptor 5AN1 [Heterocephalus glaber]|uniref:Olfactory receptor 5AN1 n=1 Tax=Heterocephalus glaber TaxID=10181 RepID=G5AP34_HETGA|nr:Olfactory receptor 5AN1 [Heterocephalus glaber]